MAMSRVFWYRWIVVCILGGTAAYAGITFNRQDSVRSKLDKLLQQTIEEKDQLQSTIESMESQLRDKESQLSQLRDVQSIRQALVAAQATVDTMKSELERVNRERATLQNENMSTARRLQSTTKEYMRTLEELKKAQDDMARLSKEANPDKKRIEASELSLQTKTQELAKVQADLAKQQQISEQLLTANKNLEKKVKDLEAQKTSLSGKMQQLDAGISGQEAPLKVMRETIDDLKSQLSRKENQIKVLEQELARADSAQARGGRSSQPSFNEAQDSRLSDILVKKEIELESTRKDALESKEKIVLLQSKITDLENTISLRKQSQDRNQELESESLQLKAKLADMQAGMSKKTELSQSLQRNLDFLNQELTKREKEKKELESRLSSLESSSIQDLEKEKARFSEINTLYNSLKTQISQFSGELEQRNKDLNALREEMTSLRSKRLIMENDLADARDRQRKTLDDLVAAVRLNTILQERIAGGAATPYDNADDRKKADELRRKIEVILVPPNKQ